MKRAGYTLIEVMVAASILMIAIAAATALALATIAQEDVNVRVARCINLHEQAVRLYQLGLDPAVIRAILPIDPAVITGTPQPVFGADQALDMNGLAIALQSTSTLTFTASDTAGSQRTSTITAVRPRYR